MTYHNTFVRPARELRNKGTQLRQLHQLAKSGGLAVSFLSGAGLVASAGTFLPLIVGVVTYAGAVLSEHQRTGKLKLIPWIEDDLGAIAVRSLHEQGMPQLGTQVHHYLEPEDKALYYLTNFQGHRLTQLAEQLESEQFEHILVNLVDHLVTAHQPALNHPELLGSALGMNFFEEAVENLPKPLGETLPAVEPTPIGPQTQLNAIAVPAQLMRWDEDAPVEAVREAADLERLQEALAYPAVLIFGASGAGKSTLAEWVIEERLKLGHLVEILDPHMAYGQWAGLPVYGAGLDYAACNQRLGCFADLVEQRYRTLAQRPNFNPRPYTMLVEEFTNWSSHCDRAGDFFRSSLSDLRKVNMHALYVSHGKTLKSLGGSSGTAQQRDSSLLMIELFTQVGPSGPEPTGRGRIYYPSRHDAPIDIGVPKLPGRARSISLEGAYSADSSDDFVALIVEILQQTPEPLLASVIRQKKNTLKTQFTTEQLEAKLQLMAMEGFIQATGSEPPRYTLP